MVSEEDGTIRKPHLFLLGLIGALALASLVLTLTSASASGTPELSRHMGKTAQQWQRIASHRLVELNGARGETRRAEAAVLWQHDQVVHWKAYVLEVNQPKVAIRLVFGRYADQALRVSACETGGTYSTSATNGQYLGLFQMGDYARGRYGHSSTALGQAKAAYHYFAASGYDWSPWECKP